MFTLSAHTKAEAGRIASALMVCVAVRADQLRRRQAWQRHCKNIAPPRQLAGDTTRESACRNAGTDRRRRGPR